MSWIKDVGQKISGAADKAVDDVAGFVKDPIEGFNDFGEELRRWRENVLDLDPTGVSEELWGEAGRYAYPSAAAIMSKRSPTGEPLPGDYKMVLKPYFGDTVEKVTIHWSTNPLDKWAADKFKVTFTSVDTEAQTYGHDIYIKYAKGEMDREYELTMVIHELVHVQQYERHGNSYSNFGYHYFKHYKRANLNYENNTMEKEAYQTQVNVMASIARSAGAGTATSWLEGVLSVLMRSN